MAEYMPCRYEALWKREEKGRRKREKRERKGKERGKYRGRKRSSQGVEGDRGKSGRERLGKVEP